MNPINEIERKLLELSPADREKLALKAWDSLVDDRSAMCDPDIDGDGIKLAMERDREFDQGTAKPIDHVEFRRRTGDDE